jgi:hypothetical protein
MPLKSHSKTHGFGLMMRLPFHKKAPRLRREASSTHADRPVRS